MALTRCIINTSRGLDVTQGQGLVGSTPQQLHGYVLTRQATVAIKRGGAGVHGVDDGRNAGLVARFKAIPVPT